MNYDNKSHGGVNFLTKSITGSVPHWTTANRPNYASIGGDEGTMPYGLTGFNTTTNKLETWDGSTW